MAALMLLIAIIASGCGLAQGGSARDVGARFSDALEGRANVRIEDLAPDVDVYLQGGLHLSRQAFLDHLENMRRGYEFFHRMSPVYATRGGAGWLLDIVHAADAETAGDQTRSPAQSTMWIEAKIDSGHIKRVWVVFTKDRVAALLQSPIQYAAKMEAQGLALPDAWADGTAAMLAAAASIDAQAESSQPAWTPIDAAPITAVAAGLLVLRVLVARRQRPEELAIGSVGARNIALLLAVRERRERACAEENSAGPVPI